MLCLPFGSSIQIDFRVFRCFLLFWNQVWYSVAIVSSRQVVHATRQFYWLESCGWSASKFAGISVHFRQLNWQSWNVFWRFCEIMHLLVKCWPKQANKNIILPGIVWFFCVLILSLFAKSFFSSEAGLGWIPPAVSDFKWSLYEMYALYTADKWLAFMKYNISLDL